MRGLVVGRFQPLHNGHVKLIRQAIEDCVDVVVGIGSSNAPTGLRNPFTLEERKRMLELTFGNQIQVVALPDIHDPPKWAAHVLALTGDVDRVFGNDDRSLALFEDADVPVRRTGLFDRSIYEASTIRMQMAEDDATWQRHVPRTVAQYLDEIGAPKRIRLLGVAA